MVSKKSTPNTLFNSLNASIALSIPLKITKHIAYRFSQRIEAYICTPTLGMTMLILTVFLSNPFHNTLRQTNNVHHFSTTHVLHQQNNHVKLFLKQNLLPGT